VPWNLISSVGIQQHRTDESLFSTARPDDLPGRLPFARESLTPARSVQGKDRGPIRILIAEGRFAALRRVLFQISAEEVKFARRGFYTDGNAAPWLEHAGLSFLEGYHLGLQCSEPEELARMLDLFQPNWRGFAYEGAAMALALLDRLTPWCRRRWRDFLAGPACTHGYMVHVGAGWAIARLPWLRRNIERATRGFDPLLRWLVVDGFGFHEGYFSWWRHNGTPNELSGYFRNAFDQGLGRSFWFVHGTSSARIAGAIAAFPPDRRGDLWSGAGLACAYAGGARDEELVRLRQLAGVFLPQVAQGIAFAAKARQRAGNMMAHTDIASRVVLGLPATEAAAITDCALQDLPADGDVPAYEIWRRRIQLQFVRRVS
jgi:hypothetical protein